MGQVVHQANTLTMHFRRFETEEQAVAWLKQVA
ncbi:hypothetical protein SAMN00120144_3696 [Hymenobacter roseosalivarius DSM 11622]|uniref:Uncharacterized protein n=1 Tax=Hymenobacter roseosalivarius DSM 11622 TaxID=645990 RepID=A0A1W1W1X7_9BACT|nr:hypothetical protein SAMN00120144_3696 [Hymenobacter roseosalivarius DSM 11622]